MDTLIKDRLEFRRLLQKYDLMNLINDESECAEWIEGQVTELVYSISKRQRLQALLREAKEILNKERGGPQPIGDLINGGSEKKPHPLSGKRFRQIRI